MGSDTNNGMNLRKPFRTLQHAADLTRPGDTVLVMNGLYTRAEQNTTVLEINRSGEPRKYIQYKAFPGHTPRIQLDGNFAGIQISAAYILIEGLTVEGNIPEISAEEALRRALLPREQIAEGIRQNPFRGSGIFAYPVAGRIPHHLIIRKNHVFNCPGGGIASNGSDYVRIENNLVHNNSYYSPVANSGISFYQSYNLDDSTAAKMFVRNNVVYGNENKVPFWYTNEADPSQRRITDGNGIIIDDGRNTQGFFGDGDVAYKGETVISNNLIYDNGGRAVAIFLSDNVSIRYNTTFQNGRTVSSAINSELLLGNSADAEVLSNILVARPDRKIIESYNTSGITFDNNLFSGGTGAPAYPGGAQSNLIQNGDFSADLGGWELFKVANAGFVNNVRDGLGRNCVYIDRGDLQNTNDVYLFQRGLTLQEGLTYTLSFDAITGQNKTSSFVAKIGGSSDPYTSYADQTFSLMGNQSQAKTFSFTSGVTDSDVQLELQLGRNPPASYFCFDNFVLSESRDFLTDPQFVNPSTNPATADFRLQSTSPARDAGRTTPPQTDIEGTLRPQGAAADVGAYESF